MTLTYQTQKGTSAAAALALAGDIIDSDPDSLVSIKSEERMMETWRANIIVRNTL